MKVKLIYSNFNKETGISTATVANKLGTFTGCAKLHPEDESSSFFGCELAEYRAIIKAFKYEAKLIQSQIDVLNQTYAMFKDNKNFNKNSLEARKIRKMLYMKQNKLKEIKDNIKSLSDKVNLAPEVRKAAIDILKTVKTLPSSDKNN